MQCNAQVAKRVGDELRPGVPTGEANPIAAWHGGILWKTGWAWFFTVQRVGRTDRIHAESNDPNQA